MDITTSNLLSLDGTKDFQPTTLCYILQLKTLRSCMEEEEPMMDTLLMELFWQSKPFKIRTSLPHVLRYKCRLCDYFGRR